MKIVHINVDWNSGGPGTIANDICEISEKNGIHCLAAYGRGKAKVNYDSYKIDSEIEFIIHTGLSRIFSNEGAWSIFATKRLLKKLDDFQPDIIHLHTFLGHYLNHSLLFRYIKENNIETVWTIHDCSPFTGHCINFDRVKCKKWENCCNNCSLKNDYPYSLIDTSKNTFLKRKRLYGEMDNLHLVVPSNWMAETVKKSFLGNHEISVINNGINLEQFYKIKTNLREQYKLQNKIVLLSVANIWNEMKGWKIINELAELLDDRFSLVVVGNKDENNVNKRIINIAPISDKAKLIEWYSAADIFVNPTLGDNFPTVNIEALSCGLPIVTCNTGGSPEIAGNDAGRIVYSNTAEEFVTKINECIDQGYSYEYCREYAQRYDREKCYDQYLKLYDRIVR